MQLRGYNLFPVILLLLVLMVINIPPLLTGDRYEIISDKNFLRPENIVLEPVVVSSPPPDTNIQVPATVPESDEKSFGKGYVAANFYTNVNSPYEMIEDRQHYAASGLFKVHIVHQYSG
jgi:hypothetical protein